MIKKVPAILKDPGLQKKLEEDGFVKVSLFTQDEVDSLKKTFYHHYPELPANFHSSSHGNDFTLKKRICDDLVSIVSPALERIFTNYTCFGSTFLTKEPGPRSELYMHQDWTIVDESKYMSLNLWAPLQDTNEVNGTVEIIPGSHKWHDTPRTPSLPFYYSGHQDELKKKLTVIPTRATEALVINHAVVHYSGPNMSDKIRLAVTTGVKTSGAPMLFYYWDKNKPNEIEKFDMDEDFLLRFENFRESIFQRPTFGTPAGMFPVNKAFADESDLAAVLHEAPVVSAVEKPGFAKKLLSWIRS